MGVTDLDDNGVKIHSPYLLLAPSIEGIVEGKESFESFGIILAVLLALKVSLILGFLADSSRKIDFAAREGWLRSPKRRPELEGADVQKWCAWGGLKLRVIRYSSSRTTNGCGLSPASLASRHASSRHGVA
jgi:hypothetical protein